MPSNDDAIYEPILESTLKKLISLLNEKERIDDEVAKLEQFMTATENLLSEEAGLRFAAKMHPWIQKLSTQITSLREAIKTALSSAYPAKLTAAQVRDKVRANGFDFSSYKSDPLPSVSTTLRRLREANEVTYEDFEGVIIYQAKPQNALAQRAGEILQAQVNAERKEKE